MGMDIYKYQVEPISGNENNIDDLFAIDNDLYNLSKVSKEDTPLYLFLRKLEEKTKQKYIHEVDDIGYNLPKFDNIDFFSRKLNFTFFFNSEFHKDNKQETEISYEYLVKNENVLGYSQEQIHDEKECLKFLMEQDKNSVLIISYEQNKPVKGSYKNKKSFAIENKQYRKNKKLINMLVKKLQKCGFAGEKLHSGYQTEWFFNQNKYICLKNKIEPVKYKKYFCNVKEIGYQRKGNKDKKFYTQFYGTLYSKQKMIYLFENDLLEQVKKTFKEETPIQNWHLKENEFIFFSV